MKCANPLLMEIELDGKLYTTTVRCMKCYACQCASRAEWAVRCKYELKDPRNKSCHFITLTYDDSHLPRLNTTNFDTSFRNNLNHQLPIQYRRYWYSYLRKDHAMKFLRDMNKQLLNYMLPYFVDKSSGEIMSYNGHGFIRSRKDLQKWLQHKGEIYRKSHYIAKYPPDHVFRVYMTGEYGDTTYRAHYHLICFSPVPLTKLDFLSIIPRCWPFGQFNVSESPTAAACNYVGKHQVKSCTGTTWQNSAFPIFSLSSRFRGGIGHNMIEDEEIKTKWQNSLINRSKSGLYISNFQTNSNGQLTEYKVHIPRFVTRVYHSQRLDATELTDLMNESNKNLKKFILENRELFPNLQSNNFDIDSCDFVVEDLSSDPDHRTSQEHFNKIRQVKKELYNISRILLAEDELRRKQYERTRLYKKLKKFNKPTNFNSL